VGKARRGAFWQDRYHATAVQTGEHLARCLVYVDLNMVRAGVVEHPALWEIGVYQRSSSSVRATASSIARRWPRRWRSPFRICPLSDGAHILREAPAAYAARSEAEMVPIGRNFT
jgi:hypothetical protein